MGLMKDFDIRIRNGGDDAAGAVNELMAELQRRLLELQDSMPRWIPVTERLPDLVNRKDARYVTKERYSDPVLVFDGSNVHVGTYGDVEGWLSGYETLDSVTHWMPLPAPPTDAK